MYRNRLTQVLGSEAVSRFETPFPTSRAQGAFAFCPTSLVQGAWQQQLYLAAYAAAREAAEKSFRRQACTFSWN
jgi:hypothetical protein